jgi:hypothetical protein
MNVLKWLGHKVSYERDLGNFKVNPIIGMAYAWFEAALISYGITYRKIRHCKMKDLEEALDRGNLVVLSYHWFHKGDGCGHYSVVIRHTTKYIYGLNMSETKSYNYKKEELNMEFRICARHRHIYGEFPVMWEVFSVK